MGKKSKKTATKKQPAKKLRKKLQKTKAGSPVKPPAKSPAKSRKVDAAKHLVMVGTRKGAFFLKTDSARRKWHLSGPHFLGCIVYHVVLDPRDRRTLLLACRTGHLGHTVFRSSDMGKTWVESKRPPAFPKAPAGETGRVVDHVFFGLHLVMRAKSTLGTAGHRRTVFFVAKTPARLGTRWLASMTTQSGKSGTAATRT